MLLKRIPLSLEALTLLMKIALPMVISQGAFAVMIFTDRYFMSQISSTHIAASLGGGVASFFSFCFFTGLLSYANALAAQYFGAGEKSKCSIVLTQGLIITVLSIPLLVLISFLVVGIFSRMGHDPQMEALESTYYLILMAGSVITLAKICLSSYFAGIGRTSVVMVCDVLGLILNIPLCYVMVFGKLGFPALGIVGAGISTIVATAFSLLLFFAYYLAKKNRIEFSVMSSFVFHRQIFRRFLRLGFPSGMEIFLNVAAFNLFLLMFQSYGIAQAASAAIVFNWDILSFVPMMGLNIGVISLIGRFVGAGNMEKTDEVISAGFVLGLGYAAVLASIFIVFRFQLVDVFAPPVGDFTATRALSAFMMIGLSCYVTADAIILVAGGVLRGAGDTKWLMYSSTLLHWLMLAAQYVIIMVLQLGPKASWWAFVVMIITIAVVFVWRLQGGRWRDPKVLARVMAN